LEELTRSGKADVAEGGPGWPDERIADALAVSLSTVRRIRLLFVEQGLAAALDRRPARLARAAGSAGCGGGDPPACSRRYSAGQDADASAGNGRHTGAPRRGCNGAGSVYQCVPQQVVADGRMTMRCLRACDQLAGDLQPESMMISLFALETEDMLEQMLDIAPLRRHLRGGAEPATNILVLLLRSGTEVIPFGFKHARPVQKVVDCVDEGLTNRVAGTKRSGNVGAGREARAAPFALDRHIQHNVVVRRTGPAQAKLDADGGPNQLPGIVPIVLRHVREKPVNRCRRQGDGSGGGDAWRDAQPFGYRLPAVRRGSGVGSES
jgi:hypothetical protein